MGQKQKRIRQNQRQDYAELRTRDNQTDSPEIPDKGGWSVRHPIGSMSLK